MDFALNDIQQMLQDSAGKFVQNDYDFETRRKHSESALGYSEDHWALFAELGWLALPFEEQYGGLDGNSVDLMVLMAELGRGLLVEPFLATVVLGGNLIQRHGSAAQKETLIPAIIAGELKLAFAGCEAHNNIDITQIKTTATIDGDSYLLQGKKSVVVNAACADKLIVAARTSGNMGDKGGISLFMVESNAAGVSRRDFVTNDGGRASDIELTQVSAVCLGEADSAYAAIQSVHNDALIALCSEAVALMDRMLKATAEYTKIRKQFDVPIATFQVLQHRMVDMFMECEQARSMLYYGALNLNSADLNEAIRACRLMKCKIGQSARLVGQTAVQLHGGMGVSDELDVGHIFKRLTMINSTFGSFDVHLDTLIKQYQAG